VKAILNGLFEAINHKNNFEYFYTLSGQDYPIKPKEYIHDFLEKNKNHTFIKNFKLPNKNWKSGGLHRYNRYHFIISKNRYIRRIMNTINFFLPRRKIPYNLDLYGGEFYFGLTRKDVEYTFNFLKEKPKFLEFLKYSYIPEEIFFHTILLNQKNIANIKNQSLTYVDWSKPHGPYPATLKKEDLNLIIKNDFLFARKFDINIDSEILDIIDKKILKL
jgi:hypothetical protein